jgi:uncharacterized integral membrane protein (TIGR00698 family)
MAIRTAGTSSGTDRSTRSRLVWPPPTGAGRIAPLLPGLALVLVLGLVAQGLAAAQQATIGRIWLEALVIALLLGVLLRNLNLDLSRFDPGAAYAGKQVLEVAVVLLGVSLDAAALAATGPRLALVIALGVVGVLLLGFGVGRLLGLGPRLAFLVATGNAICGNSAIAAVAPVIKAEKGEIAASIALTAVLGVLLVLLLPLLVPLAGLSHYQYGIVAGMGVYAVPQVLAAAFPVSDLSGEIATAVKLGRVMLLGPVVLVVGLVMAASGRREGRSGLRWSTVLPWFVLGFMALAVVRNLGLLPDAVALPLRTAGTWLTILAMAGLGLGVRFAVVRTVGPRVAVAVIISLALMIGLTLTLIRLLGIDAP